MRLLTARQLNKNGSTQKSMWVRTLCGIWAKHIYLEDFVSNETINKFFRIYDNWKLLEHILSVATGHEYLTTNDNARDHITDLDLQEPLIRCLLYKSNSGVYDVFVKMTKDPNLKTIRHNIWNFLK